LKQAAIGQRENIEHGNSQCVKGRRKGWGTLSIPLGLMPVNRKLPTRVGFQGGCSKAFDLGIITPT